MKIITILFMLFVVVGLAAVGSKKRLLEGNKSGKATPGKATPCKGIVDTTRPSGCAPCPDDKIWNDEKKRCINRCSEPAPYWDNRQKGCKTLAEQTKAYSCSPPLIYKYPDTCGCPKGQQLMKNGKCEVPTVKYF
jgi:hypothetical protein